MRGIALIGPIGSGKSTLAQHLASRLEKQPIDLDFVANQTRAEFYLSRLAADRLHDEYGIMAWYKNQKPFEFLTAMRTVTAFPDAVISFGGGHSVFDDAILRAVLKSALAKHHVVLLLESENREATLQACEKRKKGAVPRELNEFFVDHVSNGELANLITFVRGRKPEEICDEIIAKLTQLEAAS